MIKIFPFIERRKTQLESKNRIFVLQEDNDSDYDTKSLDNPVRLHKDAINLDYINNWPPNSPDFNLIERIWHILKQRVKQYKCTNKEQLQDMIKKEWERITYEEINNCILGEDMHMKKRMEQALERGGFATQW